MIVIFSCFVVWAGRSLLCSNGKLNSSFYDSCVILLQCSSETKPVAFAYMKQTLSHLSHIRRLATKKSCHYIESKFCDIT